MLALAKLEHKLRPMMAQFLPPKTFTSIYCAGRNSFIASLSKALKEPIEANFNPVEVAGLKFRNDLGNAAGLDKDGSLLDFNYCVGAGFAVVGTVLNKPHTGNLSKFFGKEQNPWVPLPASHSGLNSLGLPSKGVDVAIDNIKAFQDKWQPKDFPVGVSIMGHPLQEGQEKLDGILECVEKALPHAGFIEINESCPNVAHKVDDSLGERLKSIVALRSDKTPIFVKLGDLGNVEATVKAVAETGVDGLIALNTQKDYDYYSKKLDPSDKKIFDFYTKNYQGGLSGEIIRETSFDQVAKAHEVIQKENLDLKLIHVGGISSRAHVIESRKIAELREWYTGFMEKLASEDLKQIYRKLTAV